MKILLISDLHFKAKDKYGLFPIKQRVLRKVLQEWKDKVDLLCCLGDEADISEYDIVTASIEAEIWSELGKDISKVIYLIGNHGTQQLDYCPMTPFAIGSSILGKGMTIVGRTPLIYMGASELYFRGWNGNEPVADHKGDYFFSHARVKEFVHKSATKAYTLEYLESLSYKRIFLGDCHAPFRSGSGRVISVGTLCPSDFRDEGLASTYLVFDTEEDRYQRFNNEEYPLFRTFNIFEEDSVEDFNFSELKNCIVRLRFSGSVEWNNKEIWKKYEEAVLELEPFYLERQVVSQEKDISQVVFETDDTNKLIEQEAKESQWLPEYKERAFELKEKL